ncbi:hypothetical protein L5515_015043 [Caenorhabditis briggsae]|uniref:RING-type domain-containing protein n=1 Tax=Caenorhabditis briggsae TaxID=6238 RepID=A0AAE9J7N2_CAEBR|nr:hypothetical protein L5515_015043 [Caenorhabditis briggsae]
MQRLCKFFKKTGKSKKFALEDELDQLKLETDALRQSLADERSKNLDLHTHLENEREAQGVYRLQAIQENEKLEKLRMIQKHRDEKITELEKDIDVNKRRLEAFEAHASNCGTVFDSNVLKQFLKDEGSQREKYRMKMMKARKMLQKAQEKEEGDQKAWSLCEVCAFQFADTEEQTPRVLACGHTVCQSCVVKLAAQTPGEIKCPFDRVSSNWSDQEKDIYLQKNLSLLHM